VARFLTACEEAGVNPALVVREATSGRTSDPGEVLTTEMPMLTKAFNDAKVRAPAERVSDSSTRDEGDETGTAPDDEHEVIVRRPATKAMVGKIKGEYERLGLGDARESQLEVTNRVLGLSVTSHNDLSFDQAQDLLDTLTKAPSVDDIKF
jgi:hypothetical protein